jgi:Transglutaminase-like superfamily
MVVRFETLRHLPRREKRLVLKAIWLVWQVRLHAWFNPLGVLETYHHLPVQRGSSQHAPVYQLIWAIQTATRFVSHPTSLTEALAAKALLAQYGYDSRLHVGVTKKGQVFCAHVWLSQGGDVILGDADDLPQYRPFSTVKGQQAKIVWSSAKWEK